MNSDFDYKKYSLEKLQEWVHDALSTSEASPHEIYSAIREAVREDYHSYKDHASRAYGLLALLNGERPVADENEVKKWDAWEEQYYPEEHKGSTVSSVQTPLGKESSQWTYKGQPATYQEIVADGWEMTADGFWFRGVKEDKVKKWVLPVDETTNAETGLEEYFVTFPDDLLEAADLKEGDQVEWVDQGDGSYLLRKA